MNDCSGSTGEWVLRRVGILEPEFTLQNHVSTVSLGRGEGNSKQCLSVCVSRQHATLHKVMGEDGLPYWKLRHISKTTYTFVNGNQLFLNAEVRLNDRDLISLGENYSIETAEGHKNRFLYRILAPSLWSNNSQEDVNPIEATQNILESDTPPRVHSPVLKIEPGTVFHTESRVEERIIDFHDHHHEADMKPLVRLKKAASLYTPEVDTSSSSSKRSISLPLVKVESVFSWNDSLQELQKTSENVVQEEEEEDNEPFCAFSQIQEVIVLDESDETNFLSNTFSNDYPEQSTVRVKAEPTGNDGRDEEEEEEGRNGGDEEDDDEIQIIMPPEKEPIDVIDLNEPGLELNESQKNLYHRIALKIKTEGGSSPIKTEPNEKVAPICEDDDINDDDEVIFLGDNENPFERFEALQDRTLEKTINTVGEQEEEECSKTLPPKESPQEEARKEEPRLMKTKSPLKFTDPLPIVPRRRGAPSKKKTAQEGIKRVKKSSSKDIKLKRSQMLKDIASKEIKSKEPSMPSTSSAPKVHISLSKPQEKKGNASHRLQEQTVRQSLKRSQDSPCRSPDENAKPNSSFKIPAVPSKKLRMTAETVEDPDGLRRVEKLKFNNVLSNVGSQDISNLPMRVSPSGLSYPGIKPRPPKKLKWSTKLISVRVIPRVGKGHRVARNKDLPSQSHSTSPSSSSRVSPVKLSSSSPKQGNEFTMDGVFSHILSWNTSWLEEQTRVSVSPQVDLNRFKLTHVPPVFDSYDDYCNIFFPLMFHELWASVFKDYLAQKSRPIRQSAEIFNVRTGKSTLTFSARSLLTAQDKASAHFIPRGTLIIINLFIMSEGSNASLLIRPGFGFVTNHRLIPRGGGKSAACEALLKTYPPPMRERLTFINEVSVIALPNIHSCLLRKTSKFPVFELVSYISNSLRLFRAVIDAKISPLFPSLLLRNEDSSTIIPSPPESPGIIPHLHKLNPIQRKIVLDISETVASSFSKSSSALPFLSLIQGPPGTGKSTLITSLVLQLLSRFIKEGHNPPKILLTAPSNSAVDELVKKIMRAAGGSSIKLVRVGQLNSMDRHVRHRELSQLVAGEISQLESRLGDNKSIKLEISHRQEEINHLGLELEKEVQQNPASSKINLLQRQLKDQHGKLERAKRNIRNILSAKERERNKQEITRRILDDYDIVAATLSSSLNGQMTSHFLRPEAKSRRGFSICIIDEASQCVEPESLVPLKLGFSKLIMVGDPEQLPATVSSRKAKELSYEQSLFNRLFRSSRNASTSIHRLKIQYRMHGDIARWPNHYFYGGDLTNGVSWASRNSNLFPLKLFDLSWTKMEAAPGQDKSIFNTKEAVFVARLVKELKRSELPGNKTLGVITFYSQQRKHLSLELQNLGIETSDGKKSSKTAVVVSTVDGFQGSECDVVVISCVRSENGQSSSSSSMGFIAESERLNVALTRAKYALFVVGDFQSLSKSSMWSDLLKDVKKKKCIVSISEDYAPKNLRPHFIK